MKKLIKSEFVLSSYELWYLLSLNSPATVIGFKNPMLGMLKDDLFPLIQETSMLLMDKDIIYVDSNNQIAINKPYSVLVSALTNAHSSILVGYRKQGTRQDLTKSFNLSNDNAVFLDETPDGSSYRLQTVRSKSELLDLIFLPFNDMMFWGPDTEAIYYSQDNLSKVYNLLDMKDFEGVESLLAEIDGDKRSVTNFLETLRKIKIKFSFVNFINRNDPQHGDVIGFSVIGGEQYIWLLEIIDKNGLTRISKTTLKDVKNKANSLIPMKG